MSVLKTLLVALLTGSAVTAFAPMTANTQRATALHAASDERTYIMVSGVELTVHEIVNQRCVGWFVVVAVVHMVAQAMVQAAMVAAEVEAVEDSHSHQPNAPSNDYDLPCLAGPEFLS